MIVMGLGHPNYNKLCFDFGAFLQVFEDEMRTNTTNPRMVSAIALNPSGNAQCSYHFMSLFTGVKITRRKWTKLPILADTIHAVEALAYIQGQPKLKGKSLLFKWEPSEDIDNIDNVLDNCDKLGQPVDHNKSPKNKGAPNNHKYTGAF